MIATKSRTARPAEARPPAPTPEATPTTSTPEELQALAQAESLLLTDGEFESLREIADRAKALPRTDATPERRAELIDLAGRLASGRALHATCERASWAFRRWRSEGVCTPRIHDTGKRIESQVQMLHTLFVSGDAQGRVEQALHRCVPAGLLAHVSKLRAISRVGESASFGCDAAVAATRERLSSWAARKIAALEPLLSSAGWRELEATPIAFSFDDLEV